MSDGLHAASDARVRRPRRAVWGARGVPIAAPRGFVAPRQRAARRSRREAPPRARRRERRLAPARLRRRADRLRRERGCRRPGDRRVRSALPGARRRSSSSGASARSTCMGAAVQPARGRSRQFESVRDVCAWFAPVHGSGRGPAAAQGARPGRRRRERRRCSSPRAARDRGSAPVDDVRRRRAAARVELELWLAGDDEEEQYPRRAAARRSASPRGPRWGASTCSRSSCAGTAGRRRRRRVRARAADDPGSMTRIEAVISDFGGVLTSPLLDSFAAVQDSSGISLEALGKAMAAIAERDGVTPAVRARDRTDERDEVPRRALAAS